MGFMSSNRSVYRENERIRTSSKNTYFDSVYNHSSSRLSQVTIQPKPVKPDKSEAHFSRIRNLKTAITLGFTLTLFGVLYFYGIKKMDSIVNSSKKEYKHILSKQPEYHNRKLFKQYIYSGYKLYRKKRFVVAHAYFSDALDLFPKDKQASIAYNQSLIAMCVTQSYGCEFAMKNYEELINSGTLTAKEIVFLDESFCH